MERTWLSIPDSARASIPVSATRLAAYAAHLASGDALHRERRPEAALVAAAAAQASAAAVSEKLGPIDTVVLIGIGGSSLATEAVYSALRPTMPSLAALEVLDTLNPHALARVRTLLERDGALARSAIVLASKSGETMETLMNADLVFGALPDETRSRTVAITQEGSGLWQRAADMGMAAIAAPAYVSGRMSAFTETALVPLALLGVRVEEFAAGAALGTSRVQLAEGGVPATAAAYAALFAEGYRVRELVVADPALFTLGRWWRQLLSESLGKRSAEGTRFGFVPDCTVATTDFHSVLQLRLAGPAHTVSTFLEVAVDDASAALRVGAVRAGPADAPYRGASAHDVRSAILSGVRESYRTAQIPHELVQMPALSAATIGAYMAESMAEVMCIAKLWEIDAFDQPHVEAYKSSARERLHSAASQ